MTGLPKPRLTATIEPPIRKGELGVVTVHGYDPSADQRDAARFGDWPQPHNRRPTSHRPHHCSRCRAAGRSGAGHTARSQRCPLRQP